MASPCRGPIAFIDLLGFKDWMRAPSTTPDVLCDTLEKHASVVRDAMTYAVLPEHIAGAVHKAVTGHDLEPEHRGPRPIRLEYVIFSDCIVIYESDAPSCIGADWKVLKRLIKCCSALSFSLLSLNRPFPFRGCITHGDYCVQYDRAGIIVAGKPLVDAYEFERQLECIGVVVHPDAARTYGLNGQRPSYWRNMNLQSECEPERLMLAKWDRSPMKEGCQLGLEGLSAPAVLPVCLRAGQDPASRDFADNALRDLKSAIGILEILRPKADVLDHPKYEATLQLYERVYRETSDVLARRPFPR